MEDNRYITASTNVNSNNAEIIKTKQKLVNEITDMEKDGGKD